MVLRRRRKRERVSVEKQRTASTVTPIPFFDRSRGMYE